MNELAQLLNLAALDTATLTRFARMVPDPATWTLKTYLPDKEIQGIKYKSQTTTGTVEAAKFRAWDTETPLGQRAISRDYVQGEMPPLGQKTNVGELETILQAMARGADNADLIDQIYDDVTNNVLAIRARMEVARGDLLTDGIFTLDAENGLTLSADFQLASSHKPDLSGSATRRWVTGSAATPLSDELEWIQQIATDGGTPPSVAVTARRIWAWLMTNDEYRNAFFQRDATDAPTSLTPQQFNSVRDTWGLPPIDVNDELVKVDGSMVRPIPDSQFILTGPDVGDTQWGTTAESLVLTTGSNPAITRRDAPGVIVTRKVEDDPVAVWIRATAVGMPVINNGVSYVTAKVTPAT
jgi:hypothetical protein